MSKVPFCNQITLRFTLVYAVKSITIVNIIIPPLITERCLMSNHFCCRGLQVLGAAVGRMCPSTAGGATWPFALHFEHHLLTYIGLITVPRLAYTGAFMYTLISRHDLRAARGGVLIIGACSLLVDSFCRVGCTSPAYTAPLCLCLPINALHSQEI